MLKKGEAIKEDKTTDYGEGKHITVPKDRGPLYKKEDKNKKRNETMLSRLSGSITS